MALVLLSWLLLATIGLFGYVAARAVADWLDETEDRRSMREWERSRRATRPPSKEM